MGGCQLEDGMVGFVFASVRPGWSVEIRLERREGSGTREGGYYLHCSRRKGWALRQESLRALREGCQRAPI